jgi:hypothetical protein
MGLLPNRGSARKIPQKFSRKFFRNKIGNHSGGNHQMEKTKAAPGKPKVRDSDGRFVKGNKEGRKFPKVMPASPRVPRIRRPCLRENLLRMYCTLTLRQGRG